MLLQRAPEGTGALSLGRDRTQGMPPAPSDCGPGLAEFIPQEAEQKEARIGGLQRHRLASEVTDFLIVHAISNQATVMAAEST